MADTPTLGENLRRAREAAGLTQTEAANRLGFRRHATVSDHERDQSAPGEMVLSAYADLYGTSVQALRYGKSTGRVRETYALDDEAIARGELGLVLLRMPPEVYAMAYAFMADMQQAGIPREAQDRVEVFLTQLATGQLTPGYRATDPGVQLEDAVEAMDFIRRVYQRRGVRIAPPPIDLSETPDPDAISGEEFTKQLQSQQRKKPKAG